MTLTFTPRARALLIVALVLAVAGAGLMAYTRLHKSSDSSATSTPTPVKHQITAAKPVTTQHRAAAHPKPKPQPKAKPAAPAASNQLPVAIRRALANEDVVVVALYDPKAKIDGTALREAKAGAKLADSVFVPVNVRKNGVNALNAKYGVVHDPALLVIAPPDELVVRIDGFADRDTVAQAAVDAAS